MAFYANPWAVPGLIAAGSCLAMAAVVYLARPDRRQNRILGLVLFIEGLGWSAGTGLMWLTDDLSTAFGWQMVGFAAWMAMIALYPLFLSTLDTPLVAPLRSRWAWWGLGAAAVLMAAWVLANPTWVVPAMVPVWWAPWELAPGPGTLLVMQAFSAVSLLGLVAVLHAWRRAPTEAAKRQAKYFAVAFGTRDSLHTLLWVLFPLYQVNLGVAGSLVLLLGVPLTTISFVLLAGYGILRAQLFDIDLTIKWTIRQSTVAAAFVGVFFVVSEGAQEVFSTELGPAAGLLAAGLLVFALAPLQRLGERVSDAAMPQARATPAYVAYKKLEVYRAALEGAMEDGRVSDRERAVLERLRAKLGIEAADAGALEREVLGAPA